MPTQRLNPLNDLVFKKVFSTQSQEHKKVLIAFIEAVLPLKLNDVRIASPYQIETYSIPKGEHSPYYTEVDILAETDQGEIITIELQVYFHHHYVSRTLYYLTKNFTNTYDAQAEKDYHKGSKLEKRYASLKSTYGIFISKFSPMKENIPKQLLRTFTFRDDNNQSLAEMSDSVILQAAYLDLTYEGTNDPKTNLYWFVRFLKDQPMLDDTPPIVQSAYQMINKHGYSQEELKMIDRVVEQDLLAQEVVKSAKEEGVQEGRQEGIQKGEANIILKLIKNGLSLDFVSEVTDQSKDEIRQIADEHGLSFQ